MTNINFCNKFYQEIKYLCLDWCYGYASKNLQLLITRYMFFFVQEATELSDHRLIYLIYLCGGKVGEFARVIPEFLASILDIISRIESYGIGVLFLTTNAKSRVLSLMWMSVCVGIIAAKRMFSMKGECVCEGVLRHVW